MAESTSKLTRFFRNRNQFKSIEHVVVPDLAPAGRERGDRCLHVLSAGCASGEESYSLAILLSEILPEDWSFSIRAVDRSARVLAIARRGLYGVEQTAGIPARFLRAYFLRAAGGFLAGPDLRRSIRFEQMSIESLTERGTYDLVVCRNVLTYAGPPSRGLILDRIWSAMAPHSYLVIGGAESLIGVDDRFEYLSTDWSSIYRKELSGNRDSR